MSYMPIISVRITDDERKRLLKYGPLSSTVRDALDLYAKERRRREVVDELVKFQKEHPVHVDPEEIVRIVRKGRSH